MISTGIALGFFLFIMATCISIIFKALLLERRHAVEVVSAGGEQEEGDEEDKKEEGEEGEEEDGEEKNGSEPDGEESEEEREDSDQAGSRSYESEEDYASEENGSGEEEEKECGSDRNLVKKLGKNFKSKYLGLDDVVFGNGGIETDRREDIKGSDKKKPAIDFPVPCFSASIKQQQ